MRPGRVVKGHLPSWAERERQATAHRDRAERALEAARTALAHVEHCADEYPALVAYLRALRARNAARRP